MLAMLSAHAKKRRAGDAPIAITALSSLTAVTPLDVSSLSSDVDLKSPALTQEAQQPFAEQVVPAYAKCLIDVRAATSRCM